MRRVMGKLAFLSLRDASGAIQLYLDRSRVAGGADTMKMVKNLLDAGDWVGAKGGVKRTDKGELSVVVESLQACSTCLYAFFWLRISGWCTLLDPKRMLACQAHCMPSLISNTAVENRCCACLSAAASTRHICAQGCECGLICAAGADKGAQDAARQVPRPAGR